MVCPRCKAAIRTSVVAEPQARGGRLVCSTCGESLVYSGSGRRGLSTAFAVLGIACITGLHLLAPTVFDWLTLRVLIILFVIVVLVGTMVARRRRAAAGSEPSIGVGVAESRSRSLEPPASGLVSVRQERLLIASGLLLFAGGVVASACVWWYLLPPKRYDSAVGFLPALPFFLAGVLCLRKTRLSEITVPEWTHWLLFGAGALVLLLFTTCLGV